MQSPRSLLRPPLIEFPRPIWDKGRASEEWRIPPSLVILCVQGKKHSRFWDPRNQKGTQPRPSFIDPPAKWQYRRDWALSYSPLRRLHIGRAIQIIWDSTLQRIPVPLSSCYVIKIESADRIQHAATVNARTGCNRGIGSTKLCCRFRKGSDGRNFSNYAF